MEATIRQLYNDKNFTDALAAVKSFDDASALFASHGVNISAQDFEETAMEAIANNDSLDEEMLDQVSGGGIALALGFLIGGYVIGRIIVKITG